VPSEGGDGKTRLELKTLQSDQAKVSHDLGRMRLKALRQEIRYRKKLTRQIYDFTKYWALGLFLLILLDGSGWFRFSLSDGVLMTLTGSTSVSVLGLFLIVARYFFSRPEQ
jgi:hypothetical protein